MHAMISPWNGVVLAGGRSSRMGRDKAMLPWQGRTLLEHMRERLREAGAARVVISGAHPDPDAIPDVVRDGGPAAALAQLAPRLDDGVWLLVPVDMPLLDVSTLGVLAASSADCAIFAGHPLPMRLVLDPRSRAVLAALAIAPPPQRSLRAIHQALAGDVIDVEGRNARLINCNTPEEWDALRRGD
ncbi:molybdenum cofactor guanylyltransferase [Pseudoxanthomonas sp.]|uniref:molybdenum cofactor guanylyltransferase n=1 Tax=Pseudoxanthomonas sp. TaxID=1871049 RepID=UPI003F81BA57